MTFQEGDYVRARGEPGVDGEVVEVGRRVAVAWPIPGRRKRILERYHAHELELVDRPVRNR